MKRLLIVSNRLPVTIERRKEGLRFKKSVGGLATGLASFYKSYDSIWLGWCGLHLSKKNKEEKKHIKEELMTKFNSYPIFLSKRDVEKYYYGFSNKTLWPLLHSFTQYASYDESFWKSYKKVNYQFLQTILDIARPDDNIWIHDYHLMLLPGLVREKLPDANIGFFLHIPFPPFDIFRLLPWRTEILKGLLGADLIGFHTYGYVKHFLDTITHLLGHEHTLGQVTINNRIVKVEAFPMGIDYERFSGAIDNTAVQKDVNRIYSRVGKRKIVVSIDRLDYTKGIIQRLEGFGLFLKNNPKYRGKVTLLLTAVPSRTNIEHYRQLKKRVEEIISDINGRYGSMGYVPIWYFYRSFPFKKLVSLYSAADVALVTPLRDGMNLIAKEFIASKPDGKGVLILSEMAGASDELGEAIIVNPNNIKEIANAIKMALEMSNEEQIERNRLMQERLHRYNVVRWAEDFMDSLSDIKETQKELNARRLHKETQQKIAERYTHSSNRLLLLDYDGTLMSFSTDPNKVRPDEELIELLKSLTADSKNELVIISGRSKTTLDKWFQGLNTSIVAEHGAWIKEKDSDWKTIEPLKAEWKKKIRPILEFYVDRTPGSFIEEKKYSLVWHYRKVESGLAFTRIGQLKGALTVLSTNLGLNIMEGNKIIEIKKAGIDKGRAASRFIAKRKWDFVLAIGDDSTDEDMFAVLPDTAYSIKVGIKPSKSRFSVNNTDEVRKLLKKLVGV